MAIKPWQVLRSKQLIEDDWMKLRADTCKTPQGVVVEPYYVQEPDDWVHCIALNAEGSILLIEQYRHGIGAVGLELPSGSVTCDEPPQEAIKRELLEETGCRAERWVALPPISPNPARYNHRMHAFIAYETAMVGPQKLDDSEDIEFAFYPVAEVLSLIRSGEFKSAIHTASIYVALDIAGFLSLKG